jgi:hypothetical protein
MFKGLMSYQNVFMLSCIHYLHLDYFILMCKKVCKILVIFNLCSITTNKCVFKTSFFGMTFVNFESTFFLTCIIYNSLE